MLVSELMDQLSTMDPDMEVHFGYDYGDRSHTTVTPVVDECEVATVQYSSYHNEHRLVEDGESDDDEDGTRIVVLLR